MTELINEMRELTVDEMNAISGGQAATRLSQTIDSITTDKGVLVFITTQCGDTFIPTARWYPA